MHEFEVETLPGVVLGQKRIPVQSVGGYPPGRLYPLIASAIMTLVGTDGCCLLVLIPYEQTHTG